MVLICKMGSKYEVTVRMNLILKVILYSYLILKKMNERITD